MSILNNQEIIIASPIANFVSNFIQTENVENNINAAVERVVEDIQRTWEIRKSNSILTPFDRKFKLDNDFIEGYHLGIPSRLDTVLQINALAENYWKQCNLDRDKESRPCRYREFLKGSYLEITSIVNQRVIEHFSRHEEVRVTPNCRFIGYLVPQNRYYPSARIARNICRVIPVIGWFILGCVPKPTMLFGKEKAPGFNDRK